MLQNFTQQGLVLAEIPWNNLGNGKSMRLGSDFVNEICNFVIQKAGSGSGSLNQEKRKHSVSQI